MRDQQTASIRSSVIDPGTTVTGTGMRPPILATNWLTSGPGPSPSPAPRTSTPISVSSSISDSTCSAALPSRMMIASRAQVKSANAQVEANRIALSGVREEEKVGQRTLLDVLDAEQELLDSQVDLVTVRRDLVVNSYTVLSTTGRLTAQDMRLASTLYDPEAHYSKVRRKWFGISITHSDGRREHIEVQEKGRKHKSYK